MFKRIVALFLVTLLLTSCSFVPKEKLETEPNIPGGHGEKLPETDPATETLDCSEHDPVIIDASLDTMYETEVPETYEIETQPIETDEVKNDGPVYTVYVPYLYVTDADGFDDSVVKFSEAIYKNIISHAEENENIVFSPISVIYALSLAGNGALDETYDEFSNLLGGISPKDMNASLYNKDNELSSTEKSIVKIGNSVWVNGEPAGNSLSDEFLGIADEYYSAKVEELHFDKNAEDKMNEWVKDKTDGMIDKAVDNLDPDLVMILMNTVLFDGKWEEPFEEDRTYDGVFYNYDGSESAASYMRSNEIYGYIELDGAQGVYKRYEDYYKFIAILPEGDINDFIANMDIAEIISKTRYSDMVEVGLSLPKFEYDTSINFNEILQGMGLERAFTNNAQFGGLFREDGRNVFISNVSQKAKIIMNEGGTKAAAYTEIEMPECEFSYVSLKFDKPFFYMIIDKDGTPLFLGTIYNFNEQ